MKEESLTQIIAFDILCNGSIQQLCGGKGASRFGCIHSNAQVRSSDDNTIRTADQLAQEPEKPSVLLSAGDKLGIAH